jgi:hypothetical protein
MCAEVNRIGAALCICNGRSGDPGSQSTSHCRLTTPDLTRRVVRRISNCYRTVVYLNIPRRRKGVPNPREGHSYVQARHFGDCYPFRLCFWDMGIDREPVVSLRDSGCNRKLDPGLPGLEEGRDTKGNTLYNLDYCGFDIKPWPLGLCVAANQGAQAATRGDNDAT